MTKMAPQTVKISLLSLVLVPLRVKRNTVHIQDRAKMTCAEFKFPLDISTNYCVLAGWSTEQSAKVIIDPGDVSLLFEFMSIKL